MSWEEKYSRGFHVESLKYYCSKEHAMIGLGTGVKTNLENIGKNGCNLTIAVLSMNRSSLTIRLMESVRNHIPDFQGEFLIGDNGSVEEEKKKLYSVMKTMPFKCRMVEFDRNYGVSGGRNRLYAEVHTEWLLQADNDVYFVGNPLDKIQEDIALLGCHFMSVPVLNHGTNDVFLYGGHLYVENLQNSVSVGGGSVLIASNVEPNVMHEPFLCTFLSGCVSLMRKETFFKCGAYDEGMFVGFEDTEFSVRIYQEGYKIGVCGIASIIHDHPKPDKKSDADYEKTRFSRNHIKEAAAYFEKKHGFKVWNPMVESWVEKRLNDLVPSEMKRLSRMTKPKIALIIDMPDWALDHIVDQMVTHLSVFYEFKRIYLSHFDNLTDILILASECQIVHFMWRPLPSIYYDSYTQNKISNLGMSNGDFYNKYVKDKIISVAVYDHLLLEGKEKEITKKLFSNENSIVDSYVVSSKKLDELYNKLEWIKKKPLGIVQDGVDTTLFVPKNSSRFTNCVARPIKIGWAGNSKWAVNDLKGINTIIKPAINILKKMGYNVELITTDKQGKKIPHDQMPDFYADIDIYVCASIYEGTPNPVLEAMACGVPVISTDVGIVPEVFGDLQKEFILEERSVQCLVDTLKQLLDNPEKLYLLSQENLSSIMCWDWKIMIQKEKDYFDSCLLRLQ